MNEILYLDLKRIIDFCRCPSINWDNSYRDKNNLKADLFSIYS